jgi:hypothetical protein
LADVVAGAALGNVPVMFFTIVVGGRGALRSASRLYAVMVPEFDGDRITAFYAVANPDKLAFFTKQTI